MPEQLRQIRIEGNLAFIPLTRGYEAVIDAADVPLVVGINWQARVRPHTTYAWHAKYKNGKQIAVSLHRLLLQPPVGVLVDHRDGDGLNNRRCNIRLASATDNARNSAMRKDNKAGLKGVCWDKAQMKWYAQISVNGKKVFLGRHETVEDAHAAYCEASAEMHGKFGRVK